MKILAIETNDKIYLKSEDAYSNSGLEAYFINGEHPSATFNRNWVSIDYSDAPIIVERKLPNDRINYRFILKDISLESDKIKPVVYRGDVCYFDEYEGSWYWKDEYAMYTSLYELDYDSIDGGFELVDCEIVTVLKIDEINEPHYTPVVGRGDITHQVLDKIVFPDLIMHTKKCKVSSEDLYSIVRKYIKTHIDNDFARVTSDYDFCFTVKKVVPLLEPYSIRNEILTKGGKSYATKRFDTRYVKDTMYEVFEMTTMQKKYRGYTPIEPIYASNEEELIKNVTEYCERVMAMINEPVTECPLCKGRGVVLSGD